MMKSEFDELVNLTTDAEAYKHIEAVYNYFDYVFPSKQSVANFYKKYNMSGIEAFYKEVVRLDKMERSYYNKLATLEAENSVLKAKLKAIETILK